MAASDQADTVFEAHLAAHWSETPIYFENEPEEPGTTAHVWVYAENEGHMQAQASFGAGPEEGGNLWRERGELTLHVMVPVGDGTKHGRAVRDRLAALFIRENSVIGPVRILEVMRSGGLRWEGESNGNWWAMPLRVQWEADS